MQTGKDERGISLRTDLIDTTSWRRCPLCGSEITAIHIKPHTHYFATPMPDYEGGAFVECVCGLGLAATDPEELHQKWNQKTREG